LLLNRFGKRLRIMINKCGFCEYSYLDAQGRLKCPYVRCELSTSDLKFIIKMLGGMPNEK
jgi:hypothetical protein